MVDGLNIPDQVAWLLIAGAIALALLNLGRLLRFLRIPQAIGIVVSWLAHIARDAFIQGAHEGIAEIVRQELYPNGGDNIRDVADRTEALAMHNAQQVRRLRDDLEDHLIDNEAHRRLHESLHEHMHDPDADDGAL